MHITLPNKYTGLMKRQTINHQTRQDLIGDRTWVKKHRKELGPCARHPPEPPLPSPPANAASAHTRALCRAVCVCWRAPSSWHCPHAVEVGTYGVGCANVSAVGVGERHHCHAAVWSTYMSLADVLVVVTAMSWP